MRVQRRKALGARHELRAHGAGETHENPNPDVSVDCGNAGQGFFGDRLPLAPGIVESEHERGEFVAARHAVEAEPRVAAVLAENADIGQGSIRIARGERIGRALFGERELIAESGKRLQIVSQLGGDCALVRVKFQREPLGEP